MKYFTTYWKNDTWEKKKKEAKSGTTTIDYATADDFKEAGVERGSLVFITTIIDGAMFLGGYINVYDILNKKDAESYLGKAGLYDSVDYIVSEHGKGVCFIGNHKVSLSDVKALRFISNTGRNELKFREEDRNKLDRQTLRNTRKLHPDSGEFLLSLLKK